MATDARVAALRKLARSNGWEVRSVSRARNRAPIALVAERVARPAWSERNPSQYPVTERVEVRVDSFDDSIVPMRVLVRRGVQSRLGCTPALAALYGDRTVALAEFYLTAEAS